MRRLTQSLFTLLFVFVLTAAHGCGGASSAVWPATVKCTAPLTTALVTEVEAILASGDGNTIGDQAVAALEKLAVKYGPDLVACAVEQFIQHWMAPSGTASPRSKTAAAARAQDFLNRKGVTVVVPPPS